MAPGKREVTAAESTGMRAGWPVASSRITRTALLPSTTTHTAPSRPQDGRDRVRPSVARTACAPLGPIHSAEPPSGPVTEATSRPVRENAAARWLVIAPNDPETLTARCPSSATMDPPISACTPAVAPSAAPGSVAATSVAFQPSVNRSSSGAPSTSIT